MTRKRAGVVVLLLSAVGAATEASGQDKGSIGLNLGYPTVGVTWHVAETVALRPELSFSFGSASTTSGSGADGSESDAWGVGFGISALFYVAEWEGVKGYVVPRVLVSRSSSDGLSTTGASLIETKGRTYDLSAMAGTQYALNSRISVFGEIGINYGKRHSESEPATGPLEFESDFWTLSPRSALGLIVYF